MIGRLKGCFGFCVCKPAEKNSGAWVLQGLIIVPISSKTVKQAHLPTVTMH